MANCKRCDRCGWCYDRVEHGSSIVTVKIFGTDGENTLDLCAECTDTLMKWLKPESEEKND